MSQEQGPQELHLGQYHLHGLVKESPQRVRDASHLKSMEEYKAMYQRSITEKAGFWDEIAKTFEWETPYESVFSANMDVREGRIHHEWFAGGKTNMCYNCLDRHLPEKASKVAFFWEGNEVGEERTMTYGEVHAEVCKFANVLRSFGVKRGDVVCIYMPMVLELPMAALACARIGAIHSIVFGGFSAESLAARILDCKASLVVTVDGVFRGPKLLNLKSIVDAALEKTHQHGYEVSTVVLYERLGRDHMDPKMVSGRDHYWHDVTADASPKCEVEWMDSEDQLFLLYTSGSTGQPKAVAHCTAGYMVYAATTFKYIFDYHEDDVFYCTADCGWITGHSYLTYGPMLNGATQVVFEGIPVHPDPSRFWDMVEKHRVTIFYTAPTAVRTLMKRGDEWVKKHDRSSLRILGSVGEPINPEAWGWYFDVVGEKRCYIVDTWWQTETGGIMVSGLPGVTPMKPGSASLPFFGVEPVILDDKGQPMEGPANGVLAIKSSWPGAMRTIFGDHDRFETVYYKPYPGYYFTSDGAQRDEDGFLWLTGRVDDVMNVAGHRLGTMEIESALGLHPLCAEAAVVPFPHETKGEGIYAFVCLRDGHEPHPGLENELKMAVREEISAIATPDVIHICGHLPKTRSGKVMRRILRKLVEGRADELGDISTLADPIVVDELKAGLKIPQ